MALNTEIYIFISIISYLIGAIPYGLMVGFISRGIDIRKHGSGSTGATNVLRTLGVPLASIVVILDVSKAVIAIFIASLFLNGEPLIKAIAAIFVILGHIWPITAKFRGGKGVLTGIVGLIILVPLSGILSFVLAILTICVFKIVSLGSIVGTITGVISIILLYQFGQEQHIEYLVYVIVGSIIIMFKHTDNIKRLIAKTEPKIGNRAKKTKQ
ncbi:MAG: glycerol-3-phosphate 1-O-acyltransferase PlsY [SAR202 cluster bacterium]|nr:acyl-phosphate glycerol 3-phosphate acyltransferase [Chloroflexota bacterium]MQG39609.1 glycerol-3-phosphate 1-O-acyltransferase PlsY [SAR202 cluster bacterium]|tara:strand:- start:6994 stop:7632 length:639 start_codon:yes stop_codon:yes gene_type:complete